MPINDEFYAKAAVDVTPIDEVLVRLTYRPSFRRISNYDTLAPQRGQSIPEDPAANTRGQSVLLRKYDEAERNRQRVDLMVQVTHTDTLSITPTASYIFDDYLSKPPVDPAGTGRREFLGVQKAVGWTAGVDLSWSPVERLSITAGYMHDPFYRKMEPRSRPVPGVLALDFHDYDQKHDWRTDKLNPFVPTAAPRSGWATTFATTPRIRSDTASGRRSSCLAADRSES